MNTKAQELQNIKLINLILEQCCSNKINDDEYNYYLKMTILRLNTLITEYTKLDYSEDLFKIFQELNVLMY